LTRADRPRGLGVRIRIQPLGSTSRDMQNCGAGGKAGGCGLTVGRGGTIGV
jgi:hypothetical protein